MKVSRHIIASFSAGALFWLFTKNLYAGILCFASGILIDVDHVVDYVMHCGWKDFSFKRLYLLCEQTRQLVEGGGFKKAYLIFHAGELAILLWIIAIFIKNTYLLAVALGYTLHLTMDYVSNPLYSPSYFIIWRAMKNFDVEKIFRKDGY